MKNLLLILFLLSALVSCKKDEISYPRTFLSTKVVNESYRYFKYNVEITDEKGISEFSDINKWYMVNLDTFNIENKITVIQKSSNSIEIQNNLNGEDKSLNIQVKNGITYWEEDSIYISYDTYLAKENFFNFLPLQHEFEELPVPPNVYASQLLYKPCYYIEDQQSQLLMPMMDYYVSSSTPKKLINNSFNEAFLNANKKHFILMVHEYSIQLDLQ